MDVELELAPPRAPPNPAKRAITSVAISPRPTMPKIHVLSSFFGEPAVGAGVVMGEALGGSAAKDGCSVIGGCEPSCSSGVRGSMALLMCCVSLDSNG